MTIYVGIYYFSNYINLQNRVLTISTENKSLEK